LKGVDVLQMVDDFIACWITQSKLDVDPSLVTLRLVKCGAGKPSAAEEAVAAELDDPSLSLADAGVSGMAWLLAFTASSACAVNCACRSQATHGILAQTRRCTPLRPPVRMCRCPACCIRCFSDVAVAPTGVRPALRVPSNVSPSNMGLFWHKYQWSDDYSGGCCDSAYACFRPPVGPPRALPAALVHPAFGRFLDAAAAPLSSLKHDYAVDSNATLALLEHMPRYFSLEVQRQDVLLPILSSLLNAVVAPFSPSPGASKSRTDGGILLPLGGGMEALLMVLELKNDMGSGGGDPWFQAARAAELFWAAPERATLRACGVCPTLLLEVVGPMLRVSALAMLPDGGVLMEPLTPFLSCLPVVGQPRALDALIAALRALRFAVDELQASYAALQPTVRVCAGAARTLLPYPLAEVAAFTDVRHWCDDKLLFEATHVPSGRAVCVKFTPRAYGADVHAAWAAAGLAPALLEHRVLPGGIHMIVMELLRPDQGWRMLAEQDVQQRRLMLPAVLGALRTAHAVPLPSGGVAAHGDCRDANVLVRQRTTLGGGVAFDVRFVDFDWAGRAGAAVYPPLMAPAVEWPSGALPGAPLEQAHDEALLTGASTT
jgi:hypothetical protein